MKNELLDTIQGISHRIIEECQHLVFPGNFPGEESLTFRLHDVMDPAGAQNRCSRVSEVIMDALDFSSLMGGLKAKFTGIQTPAGNHYAILLSMEGEPEENGVILDFTARQYGEDAPFPLIMDCWEWQQWTESKLGRIGSWYHSYTW
jgi:hypothetical protein